MRKRSAAELSREGDLLEPPVIDQSPGTIQPRCFNALWQGNRVVLLERDGDRVLRHEYPAEYSAFIRASEFEPAEAEFRRSSRVRGFKKEGDWYRVKFASYDDRQAVCKPAPGGLSVLQQAGIEPFEADVNPVKRWLVDTDFEVQSPRRCFLDLEADSRVPFSEKSRMRILCWSIVDAQTGRRVLGMLEEDTDAAEAELLEDLFFELQDYDQVCAWYGGEFDENAPQGFDFPLLAARTKRHGIRLEPRRWLWLDYLECFRKFNASSGESGDEKASLALDAVSKKILGEDEGKLDGVDGSMSWQLWERGGEDRKILGRYCVHDTELLYLVDQKTHFCELLDAMCRACGTFPDNYGMKGVNYVESFVMRLARRRGEHFPSNWRNKGTTPFEGARVFEPTETGVIRNVHVCDFSGMYPSIIQTWNMSLETHVPELSWKPSTSRPSYLAGSPELSQPPPLPPGMCRVPRTGEVFRTGVLGILVEAIDAVRKERKYYDNLKKSFAPGSDEFIAAERAAQAAKIFVNTFYGVIGAIFSRLFRREIAESVTQAGVWMIETVAREAEKRGMRFLYGDTDSGYIAGTTEAEFRAFVAELNDEIFPRLIRELGCERNEIEIAYEKEFEILVLLPSKKRYAGRYRHYKGKPASVDSKPEIKGLEYKRGDSAKICRDFQRRVIEQLLAGEERVESFVELVKQERERVLTGELDRSEFVMTKSLSTGVDNYAVKKKKDGEDSAQPIHVQVAKRMRELGMDVSEGQRIAYVVTDASDKLKAVPLCEYVPGTEDRFYLWENLVYPATQRVLEACFKGHDWRLYERARPPKPKRGKPVPEEQSAFLFALENPGSQAAASDPHAKQERRTEAEGTRHSGGPSPLRIRTAITAEPTAPGGLRPRSRAVSGS